jgi:cellulose synthase/poly-beta-1,6-N-acetylglucosamine synthase-like glycosyltransferase/peptidoglycan/xylan/chitin deacetylase (PgdA/CDA1 family)/spore germination protein YaaH
MARRSSFVFLDPNGRRWPRMRFALVLGLVLLLAGIVLAVWSVWIHPALRLPASVRELKGQLKTDIAKHPETAPNRNADKWKSYLDKSRSVPARIAQMRAVSGKTPVRPAGEVRLGFYSDYDPNALTSLHDHASQLTHLAPEWLSVTGPEGRLTAAGDPALLEYCTARGIAVVPVLRNLEGDQWQPEAVENLARGPAANRARFVRELAAKLAELKVAGVMIEFDQLDPAYRDEYTALLAEIAATLHSVGRELWLCVSLGDPLDALDLESLSDTVDRFVAQMFDETSDSDSPGPIASRDWFEGWLRVIENYGDKEQWVAGLGAFAYDWNVTSGRAETISFRDAMSRASYAGLDRANGVIVGAPEFNGRYTYSEPNGEHSVTFLDAVSFYNQLRTVRGAKLGGIGIHALGGEDPQIWDVLEMKGAPSKAALAALGKMRADQTVTNIGRGEIVSVDDSMDDGVRTLSLDADGQMLGHYTDFPTFPVLYHQGAEDPRKVSLTFDDGPDPEWTPKILDILKARGVKAAFFIVGHNGEFNPGLVKRIVAEGHEIGNHTYTHANLTKISRTRMRLELDATQRLIESLTGRSTTLFRPPYNADSTPSRLEELVPLKFAESDEMGYTVVLEKIDPQDWSRPGAGVILQRVKEQRKDGNIILLHDAGGDRSQTVEALPRILDWLEARGDQIVPIGELLNIPRDDLMPPVSASSEWGFWRFVSSAAFPMGRTAAEVFWAFMIAATVLTVARTLLVVLLASRHHARTPAEPDAAFAARAPAVSVLIAAYNEGRVIKNTLRSVVDTDYPGEIEFIVVDDGSSDDTAEVVQRLITWQPKVKLVRQANAGKSAALGNAIANAKHEVLVFLDADTHFERQTIRALVERLDDPKVAAVSGHARVGNRRNFVTHCQCLEYVCGFNLDRRAYSEWNCITVIPGAVSAIRRSALEEAGGFSHDTLAEDTDLTLTFHRLGYRMDYSPEAIAWTEAPETWRGLAKQRFRWCFGTMQCLWKHRDMTFNPRYRALGWFSLPGIWFFQILLVALVPLVDLVLVFSIVTGGAMDIWHYFAVFLGLDLVLAALACWMEGEPLVRALLIVPMRFVYRWLLAWVVWKSIFRVMKGALVGWGKLDRTATVGTTP